MINVNNFKPGMTFQFEQGLYVVISSTHSKQGRGQASVRAKIKNLRTGTTVFKTWTGGDKVEEAHISKVKMNFLYNDTDTFFFMDNETYEQIEISAKNIEWERNFLVEGSQVQVRKFESEILDIELPANVPMKIAEAEEATKGNTQSRPMKQAKLQTGFEIEVPMFVNAGETIIVSTDEGKYLGRG